MWFMTAAFALPVFLLIWFVLGLFLSKIRRRTVMFILIMSNVVYWLAFIGGLMSAFFFEPDSYWKSMEPGVMNILAGWDSWFSHIDNDHFYLVLLAPYYFVYLCYKLSLYVLFTHFTLCLAFFYSIAAFCLYNWLKAAYLAQLIRTPNWGFGKVNAGKSDLEKAFAWRDNF